MKKIFNRNNLMILAAALALLAQLAATPALAESATVPSSTHVHSHACSVQMAWADPYGRQACYNCAGSGRCWNCGGTGRNSSNLPCYMCGGSGRCYYCSGTGYR